MCINNFVLISQVTYILYKLQQYLIEVLSRYRTYHARI